MEVAGGGSVRSGNSLSSHRRPILFHATHADLEYVLHVMTCAFVYRGKERPVGVAGSNSVRSGSPSLSPPLRPMLFEAAHADLRGRVPTSDGYSSAGEKRLSHWIEHGARYDGNPTVRLW